MAYIQRNSPFKKQDLSPKAAADKADRDLVAAKTPYRKFAKRDSQKKHRRNPDKNDMDYDHKDNKFKSTHDNRGNDGIGTKKEQNGKKKKN